MTLTQQKISNISIIIPTLNEAQNFSTLQPLLETGTELIVVDGGSTDDTIRLARSLGFRVETCSGGRGAQLNFGARCATSPLLLFLHADTLLPADFKERVTACLAAPDIILGAFRLRVPGAGWLLQRIIQSANLRSQLLQLPYGDQALFLRKEHFNLLGGFPELPIMEDYVFVRQAKKMGKVITLPQEVCTSGRRWQRLGPFRTTLINQLIICAYHLGVPAQSLASFYRRGLLFGRVSRNKGTNLRR
ncbi:MAG: TIGR04283 family arsenosugar biosynthesis glycosyltransferase [Proteobacteria bacterium]|nr:TIGR04283 family arsenosugar biosynthesis glycosyltransferase [Pseudomonadota bacterium]MBU1060260.1 TIGR04283 family arsenosugar biosynthesis glycosyltransferase [Pseudomonadota bacterium]